MQSFIEQIFGTTDLLQVFVGWLFGMVGVLVSLLLHTTQRDPASQRTPESFSWKFLFKDNYRRLTTSVLLVFLCLRFSSYLGLPNREDVALMGFITGLGLDKIVEVFRAKNK